eukprot:scaffold5790_cov101-Isochrysis_galbana.AAC.8
MTVHTPPPKKPSQVLFGEMERKGREVNRLPDGRRGRSRARGGFSQRGHAAGLVGWAAVVASGHWAAGGKLGHPMEEGSRVVEEGSGSWRTDHGPGGGMQGPCDSANTTQSGGRFEAAAGSTTMVCDVRRLKVRRTPIASPQK